MKYTDPVDYFSVHFYCYIRVHISSFHAPIRALQELFTRRLEEKVRYSVEDYLWLGRHSKESGWA